MGVVAGALIQVIYFGRQRSEANCQSGRARVANKNDAFDGESRVALADAKDATQQHGGVTWRFLTA
jgi:hypothetical protein